MANNSLNSFLKLTPSYRDYVWGGASLRPGHALTAEAWVVWEGDLIETGEFAGKTLGEVSSQFGEVFVGTKTAAQTGTKFPLLIKLLDCAQWLSLQVHPDDDQAIELESPGQFGKTEAWHILEAEPEARLIAGLKPNTPRGVLADAIRNGTILEHVQYASIRQGDTVFMPAGTLHALGPGLLVYEVQQTSDLTYRVYDWGRPASEKRPLHIEKSIRVTRTDLAAPITPMPDTADGTRHTLVQCEYFKLEMLAGISKSIELDTLGESFHAITIIEGNAILKAGNEQVELERFQTAIVPAQMGSYQFQPIANCRALKSSTA
jgi:mannose-6-phosphate isomerase